MRGDSREMCGEDQCRFLQNGCRNFKWVCKKVCGLLKEGPKCDSESHCQWDTEKSVCKESQCNACAKCVEEKFFTGKVANRCQNRGFTGKVAKSCYKGFTFVEGDKVEWTDAKGKKNEKLGRCVKNQCTCDNGTAANGTACTTHGAEQCTACNSGYVGPHVDNGVCYKMPKGQ